MNEEIINDIIIDDVVINDVQNGDFVFKVISKSFADEIGVTRTVVGIKAKIVGNIECNLSEVFSRQFYISFVLDNGLDYGQRNASTNEFVARMIQQGTSEEDANLAVYNICKNLEYGTKEEKYSAGAYLAGAYGYQLLAIEEQ